MEYLIKVVNFLDYNHVTVDSDPVVLYAASILVLAILALVFFIYYYMFYL